jgi:hypothetical protein
MPVDYIDISQSCALTQAKKAASSPKRPLSITLLSPVRTSRRVTPPTPDA